MERKEAVYKGLEFIPTYFEDNSLTSPNYFQITEFPTKLTAGKNVFKLRGHPTNLKSGGILGVEVLDYNGAPIYHQIVDFIDEDKSRAIAIYIYEETSPGDCIITLVAEAATIEGAPVPLEWQGKANIKWSRTIPVNPSITNISEIIFEQSPTVTVKESIGVQLDRSYPNDQQFPTYNTGTIKYYSQNGQPIIEILGGLLNSEMKGGTVTVSNPTNPSPTATYTVSNPAYVSTIKKILNTGSALLDTEYTVYSSESISAHTYNNFDYSSYTINYEATPTYTATENSQSFAYIQISGLDPATGDISRIKVFTNNNGTPGTWDIVNDFEIEETEIFIENTSSLFPDETIGLFTSQSLIDFWEANTFLGNTTTIAPSLIWYTSSLSGGAKIDSSVDISNTNSVHTFQVKDNYIGTFIKDSAYKIRLDAIGTRSSNSNNLDPKLSIYLSGSSFNYNSTDYLNQELPVNIGKKIGELKLSGNVQRVDDKIFSFKSDNTGTGKLIFVIESGDWQLADVHVVSDNDSGYTPNYTRIKIPIETTHKLGNQISFKIEYYNAAGTRSKQISYVYNKDWEGGNRYIDGDYSLMTGSLYVADSLSSGVAISGYPNSGFIRSLGYEGFDSGFPGFLLWSGSAMPGQTSKGAAYSGVGLELYANTGSYFRYSTSDDELDIRTTNFFLGHPSSSFVSGSNGLLEISSSTFHVTNEGKLTGSAAIFRDSSTGIVMFDTNNKIIDALNVGRIVHKQQSSIFISSSFSVPAGSFMTSSMLNSGFYVLPGETDLHTSFFIAATSNDASNELDIFLDAYIASASFQNTGSSGASTNVLNGLSFSSPEKLNSSPIYLTEIPAGAGNVNSGLKNLILTTTTDIFEKYQGKYVEINCVLSSDHAADITQLIIAIAELRTGRSMLEQTLTFGQNNLPPIGK